MDRPTPAERYDRIMEKLHDRAENIASKPAEYAVRLINHGHRAYQAYLNATGPVRLWTRGDQ